MERREKILFLSGLYPKEFQDEIFSNAINYIDNAANALQWKYVNGFDSLGWAGIKLLNAIYIGSFPLKYRRLFVKTRPFMHCAGASDIDIGFCNLQYYKMISRHMAVKRILKKEIRGMAKDDRVALVAYALTYTNAHLLRLAKNMNPNIKTMIIVPDLPEYMDTSNKKSILRSVFKNLETRLIMRDIKTMDHFVFLTKAMAKYLGVKRDYSICDGLVDNVEYIKPVKESKVFNVVYTGSLNERYGIKNLIDGFMKIDNRDFRLTLCGGGDSVDYIKDRAGVDKRIDYRGLVSLQVVREIQLGASVLINPRTNDEAFVEYSFPSKVLEYMSVGRPVLTYKLSSYDKIYDDLLVYISETSTDQALNIKDALINLSELSNERREKIGFDCFMFVINNRTPSKVVTGIIDKVRAED